MLLYITAEDILDDGAPRGQGPRPLHRMPQTVAGLYDLGLRHHVRDEAMAWPSADGFEAVPDWKLDRLAIRVALFGRERLGVEPGERVAVFGRLGGVWPVVDFAGMGFGAVPVGIEHDLPDAALVRALAETRPRVVFASDPDSADRLLGLHRGGATGESTVVAEGVAGEDRVLSLESLLEQGSIFDTAERAQSFRAFSRQIAPPSDALWHVDAEGIRRLTHAEAMESIAAALRARPAADGDVAYVSGPRVDLAVRLALAAFVGDGRTTTALGVADRTREDVAALRPHKMIVAAEWLDGACAGQGPRWPAGLDRPWARRRVRGPLGDRLRWVETRSGIGEPTARALDAAGVTHHVVPNGAGLSDPETHTETVH